MFHEFVPLLEAFIAPRTSWVCRLCDLPLSGYGRGVPELPSLQGAYPPLAPPHDPRQGYVYLVLPSPLRVTRPRPLAPCGGLCLSPASVAI